MLDSDELEEILDRIIEKVTVANRAGTLRELLESWGLSDMTGEESYYETEKDGKIVVIGDSHVKQSDLEGIAKSLGVDKDRFEFNLEYNDAKRYDYSKLQYETKYRVVMFGPTPHSTVGKHYSSSVIPEMESHEGYPRVVRLVANGAQKITKSNFREALTMLLQENYI